MSLQTGRGLAYWLFIIVIVIGVMVFGVFVPELVGAPNTLLMFLGFAFGIFTIPVEITLSRKAWGHFRHTKIYNSIKIWTPIIFGCFYYRG